MNIPLTLPVAAVNGIEIVAVVVALGIVVLVLQSRRRKPASRLDPWWLREMSPVERPASGIDPILTDAELVAIAGGNVFTWRCDICKERRPDALIVVHSIDISTLHGSPPGSTLANVKVCKDRPECFDHRKAVEFAKHAFSPEARS